MLSADFSTETLQAEGIRILHLKSLKKRKKKKSPAA